MKYLLDTHAFLWWVADDPQLSSTAKEIIADPDNKIYFSIVSAWEIIIKSGTRKLSLPEPPEIYIPSRLILINLKLYLFYSIIFFKLVD